MGTTATEAQACTTTTAWSADGSKRTNIQCADGTAEIVKYAETRSIEGYALGNLIDSSILLTDGTDSVAPHTALLLGYVKDKINPVNVIKRTWDNSAKKTIETRMSSYEDDPTVTCDNPYFRIGGLFHAPFLAPTDVSVNVLQETQKEVLQAFYKEHPDVMLALFNVKPYFRSNTEEIFSGLPANFRACPADRAKDGVVVQDLRPAAK